MWRSIPHLWLKTMNDAKIGNLITECKQIEEDSMYTAETHYIIGSKLKIRAYLLKFVPPIITALSATVVMFSENNTFNWITLIGAIVSIGSIILEPEKQSRDHITAAKEFTNLKHEARSLHETFSKFMSETDFYHEVKRLREKYNGLTKCTPPNDDEEAWEKATSNIKSGRHRADFRDKE